MRRNEQEVAGRIEHVCRALPLSRGRDLAGETSSVSGPGKVLGSLAAGLESSILASGHDHQAEAHIPDFVHALSSDAGHLAVQSGLVHGKVPFMK